MTKIFIFLSIFISLVGFSNSAHSKTKTPQELNREFLETSKKWKTYGDIIENISQNVSPEEAQWLKNQDPSLTSKKYYQPQINKSETVISYPNLNLTLEIVSVEKATFKINRKTWIHDPTLKLDQAFEKLRQLLIGKTFSIFDRAEAEPEESNLFEKIIYPINYLIEVTGNGKTCENQFNAFILDSAHARSLGNSLKKQTAQVTYGRYCAWLKQNCKSYNTSGFSRNGLPLKNVSEINCEDFEAITGPNNQAVKPPSQRD